MKYDPELYHLHPRVLIKHTLNYIRESGAKKFLNSPKNKRLRENYLVSCFALGLRKFFKSEFYLKKEVGDPPDFELVRLTERPIKERPFDRVVGEMVTIPSYVDSLNYLDKSKKIVMDKLQESNAYETGTMLLIFINSMYGTKISEFLRTMLTNQNKYPMIWSLYFSKVNSQTGFEYVVEQIYPNYQRADIVLIEEIKRELAMDEKIIERYLPK